MRVILQDNTSYDLYVSLWFGVHPPHWSNIKLIGSKILCSVSPYSSSWISYLKPTAALPFLFNIHSTISLAHTLPLLVFGRPMSRAVSMSPQCICRRGNESPFGLSPETNSIFYSLELHGDYYDVSTRRKRGSK